MALQINAVTKYYGKKKALDHFSADLSHGIYGLLGPNGAGKSTLMNIIADNYMPDEGEILWEGQSSRALGRRFRAVLGFMPQQQNLYDGFTAFHFLAYMAALKGLEPKTVKQKIDRMLEKVELKDEAYHKLGRFSGGMKQRVLIAAALLNDPKILILDEPTAGLDPKQRIAVRNLIAQISFDKTVLIATHLVSDIESIAQSVLMIHHGRLLDQKSPRQFIEQAEGKVYTLTVAEGDLRRVESRYLVSNIIKDGEGRVCVKVVSDTEPDGEFPCVRAVPTLDDVYLSYFGDPR